MREYVFDDQINNAFGSDCFIARDKDSCFATVMVGDG